MRHANERPRGMTWNRRGFLKRTAWATVAVAAGISRPGAWAAEGTIPIERWDQYIPAEKGLRTDWLNSLTERGTPTVYLKSRDELRHIGMPVGGVCCGTLYLGGDGRLWNWDIFNQRTEGVLPRRVKWSEIGMDFQTGDSEIRPRDGATYVRPAVPADSQDIAQGFALRVTRGERSEVRRLEARDWAEVAFTGQYPVGRVRYSDPGMPVAVELQAYSPFVPLAWEDSSLPVSVFRYEVTNTGTEPMRVELGGWLQNAVCFHSAKPGDGRRVNRVRRTGKVACVAMGFEAPQTGAGAARREDLLVDDFESGYERWTVEGEAFGQAPARRDAIPAYQGEVGGDGNQVVNSHATAPGGDVGAKDAQVGRLVSAPFRIARRYLAFSIGGGRGAGVGMRLRVDGQVVRSSSGQDGNRMRRDAWPVAEWEGREAMIEIFDEARGGWGNIGVDQIVQTDDPPRDAALAQRPDYGTLALAAFGSGARAFADVQAAAVDWLRSAGVVSGERGPLGAVMRAARLKPGASAVFRFAVAWHFPNTQLPVPDAKTGNHYGARFADAFDVVRHVATEGRRLEVDTFRWRDTWYDSTLPYWFLDRTFANTSILATTTAHRFASGRFWGWEGIGCCEGTCTHVWHYAQAMGRLFPEIERDQRERVDFGVGFDASTGVICHRAEGTGPAVDGQCGRILGVWREHQMSVDDAFLRRVWPQVKQSVQYLLAHDRDGDGLLDGAQENTLDAAWYGGIAWITSLSLAALRAAEEMALELGDDPFASRCRARYTTARAAVETQLFNGEYFIQVADRTREKSLGTYEACHIDQVHGQSWAWQVNLGRVLDREKTLSALRSLWKYNFAPDVGPFRRKFTAGRPYALPGEAGLVMTSNPRLIPHVYGTPSWQIGYFNECMSGFEHQVASHMMAEGMVTEALAVTRAIHDRYHAVRRNPYNEIECSDHYARAMASYGTFISACGFECHGPSGHLGFAPRVGGDSFRAAFTAAAGWGTFWQDGRDEEWQAGLEVRHGAVGISSMALDCPTQVAGMVPVMVRIRGRAVKAASVSNGQRLRITLGRKVLLERGDSLRIRLAPASEGIP